MSVMNPMMVTAAPVADHRIGRLWADSRINGLRQAGNKASHPLVPTAPGLWRRRP